MPIRRLALIGCASGPWIDVSRVRRPALRVTGLKAGEVTCNYRTKSGGSGAMTVVEDGQQPLTDPHWVQIEASSPTKSLICEIVDEQAA